MHDFQGYFARNFQDHKILEFSRKKCRTLQEALEPCRKMKLQILQRVENTGQQTNSTSR